VYGYNETFCYKTMGNGCVDFTTIPRRMHVICEEELL